MSDRGMLLRSVSHPVAPWWRRIFLGEFGFLRRSSLEKTEVSL